MVNAAQNVLVLYDRLLELLQQQLFIANKQRYEDQLDTIMEYEPQKEIVKSEVDRMYAETMQQNAIESTQSQLIINKVEQIAQLNQQLHTIILNWYEESSHEMKQVSTHRKTLHSYGGVNNSDIISYYFDKKQ